MHKLMPLIHSSRDERVKLHYVPKGALRCQYCTLSAPRMRMFYTDDPDVWSTIEMGDVTPFSTPKLVDDQGCVIRAEACVKLPF